MVELRDYQLSCAAECVERIQQYGIAFLAAEIRCGKTLTSLSVAQSLESTYVLFVTKKKAMSSIQDDYDMLECDFKIKIINYDQLHNVMDEGFDFVIADESHCIGAFPKPSIRQQQMKRLAGNKKLLFLSGTPTPETTTQFFHQFQISDKSPWIWYKNFYMWAGSLAKHNYVFVNQKRIANQKMINDYSKPNSSKIFNDVKKYIVSLSQKEAGFQQEVKEIFCTVPMNDYQKEVILGLRRDKIFSVTEEQVILADTAVKMQGKLMQAYSGTIKFENGESIVLSDTKIKYIKERFAGQKIAIYYSYIAEGNLLRKHFPNHTDSPEVFNADNNTVFICQVVSGREGVSLRTADALVMYNIPFSATSYWQVRGRMQYKDRTTEALLYWIFSEGINGKKSIEEMVHEAVSKKKNYTSKFFVRDLKQMF